jgi:hypothetical protein
MADEPRLSDWPYTPEEARRMTAEELDATLAHLPPARCCRSGKPRPQMRQVHVAMHLHRQRALAHRYSSLAQLRALPAPARPAGPAGKLHCTQV